MLSPIRTQKNTLAVLFLALLFGSVAQATPQDSETPPDQAVAAANEPGDDMAAKPDAVEKEELVDGIDKKIDEAFKPISDFFFDAIFFQVFKKEQIDEKTGKVILGDDGKPALKGVPFVLILLVFSAAFFTIVFGFVNITKFGTAINVVRGKYDDLDKREADENALVHQEDGDIVDTIGDESSHGEVSHFQALATAVSGTVGNGNIAGVALAIGVGGPGATFWMIACGLLGMSTKFVECTLGVHYRDIDEDGTVYGGPMYYLSKGLKERGLGVISSILAVIFAVCCIGGSFGGGNAAQSNQATLVIKDLIGLQGSTAGTLIGIVMAVLVGIIIIGGIKRIASVTEKIVPLMAVMYLLACLYIIVTNLGLTLDAFKLIFSEAFTANAVGGGVIGILLIGFTRAAFSNEAGAGSASIAHSAVKTRHSASEGLVALLEPFIDTVVICTMTALVIIIFNTGGAQFDWGGDGTGAVVIGGETLEGAGITSKAFAEFIPYSNIFLTVAVVLFAVSTMISWSYYGLQSWKFLFGRSKIADLTYKLIFCLFIVIGSAANMSSIWKFSDAMIFAMVFPNMVGLFILFPVVRKELRRYLTAIRNRSA